MASVFLSLLFSLSSVAGGALNSQKIGVWDPSYTFDGTITIGAPVSMDGEDKWAVVAQQQIGAWQLWATWVNKERSPPGIKYNGQYYKVEILEVEDESNSDIVTSIVQGLVSGSDSSVNEPDFYFAPYSSGLTGAALAVTEANNKMLMSPASTSGSVWTTDVKYGFTIPFTSGGWYADQLGLYFGAGARTAAYFCDSNADANLCAFDTQEAITKYFTDAGLKLSYYYPIDTSASTYETNLADAVATISAAAIDIVYIRSYEDLCTDLPPQMQSADYTPKGMALGSCIINTPTVVDDLGTQLYYATIYSMYDSAAVYTSGITGYTNQEFVSLFEAQYSSAPQFTGAAAFAGGEVLTSAIENTNSLNVTILSNYIMVNSFSTIMSSSPIAFAANHQADGSWAIQQYTTAATPAVVNTQAELTYPMPAWNDRVGASDDNADDDDDDSSSNGNGDYYTNNQKAALACGIVFSFLGGGILTALIFYVMADENRKAKEQGGEGGGQGTAAPALANVEMTSPIHQGP